MWPFLPRRAALPGVRFVHNWTAVAGAFEGLLAAVGRPASTAWVMGISGHAFRLAVVGGEQGAVGADGPGTFSLAGAAARYRDLDVELEPIAAPVGDPRYEDARRRIVRAARRAVARGWPVLLFGAQVPDWGLVKGCDLPGQRWLVSTSVSEQFGEALAWSMWPLPGRASRVAALVPRRLLAADQAAAARRALRWAVAYAEAGEPDMEGTHGLAAYGRWRDALLAGEPLDPVGHALCIAAAQAARQHAAVFVGEAQGYLPSASRPALEAAGEAFDGVALALSRLMTLFPYPAGGPVENSGLRRVAAGLLERAEVQEREAIGRLADAVAGLPADA